MSFWRRLGQKKLDDYKLSDAPQPMVGSYMPSKHQSIPSQLCLGDYSFDLGRTRYESVQCPFVPCYSIEIWEFIAHTTSFYTFSSVPSSSCLCPLTLVNCNTKEDFQKLDKMALLKAHGS